MSADQSVIIRSLPHLREWCNVGTYPNPLLQKCSASGHTLTFVKDQEYVVRDIIFHELPETVLARGPFYVRAGPRKEIAFHPKDVKAAIVTCGGLCPGLNNVVREIVMCLYHSYGVSEIFGIRYGYRGFYDPELAPIKLDPITVDHIHHDGGSVLGSSRGGMDKKMIVDSILDRGYNQLYVIGGDGTHKGAQVMYEECRKRGIKAAVAGVPKTIDNDIPLIDRSFGFDTAVEEAQRAINSANVEAKSCPNGVSIVKLMGRSAGFIAVYAALASRDVNLCLIPEVKFKMEALLAYLKQRLLSRGHAVVVIAEGAGQDLFEDAGKEKDASGNVKFSDIGMWLKDRVLTYFASQKMEVNVKYIDPTYMIRTIPANAADSVYCTQLAHNAVHGVMHGFSGFTVACINQRFSLLPFNEIMNNPQRVDPKGRMWTRLVTSTGQPDFS